MATLSNLRLAELLQPYYPAPAPPLLDQLSTYLDLLVKWNARTNLSAIREPEEMVRRHFGESLFAAQHLPKVANLLDLGSGAGFPGLPIALARPEIAVTLAESQNKKASFLREVVRTLGVSVEVWGDRIEKMPVERRFMAVALRAVDRPALALELAQKRLEVGGWIVSFTSRQVDGAELEAGIEIYAIPGSASTVLEFVR